MASFGENFGALIRRKREEEGLSLAEMALRAFGNEDKQSRISELENGAVKRPHAKTINAFIEAFDLSPEEIEECRKDTPLSKKHISDMTSEEYEERLDIRVAKVTAALSAAHEKERSQLQAEIDTLQQRAAEPERALEEAKARIAELEPKLDRLNNIIDPEKITAAKTAMQDEDYTLARELLEEQRAKAVLQKQDADQSLAEIEYDLGLIAEAEIRWHDAAVHFIKARDLNPCFKTLRHSWDFYWKLGKHEIAEKEARLLMDFSITEYGENSKEHGISLSCLGISLQNQGKFEPAEAPLEKVVKISKTTLGEDHQEYAILLNNLAALYDGQGKYDQAEPLYLQAIEIDKTTIGEEHPNYAAHLNNLALLYDAQGKYDQAEPLYLQAIEIDKTTIGEEHPEYAKRLNNLALLYDAQGKYDQAEPLYLQAIEIGKNTIGEEHPDYAILLNNLAELYNDHGKYDQAEPLYLQAIEIDKKTIGEEHPEYAKHLNNLAGLYRNQGKYDQAEPLYVQAIDIAMAALGADHPDTKTMAKNYQGFLQSKPQSPHA